MKCSVLQMSRLSWAMCLMLLMLLLLGTAQGCFIRNCPRGGKRAVDAVQPTRQCMSCGPEGVGQCVGPSVCCGLGLGCLMGTPETEVCQKENESSVPCAISGRRCGMDNTGNCVADGICCVEDACSFNSLCRVDTDQEDSVSARQELLTLIRRLLVNRQYD
uniref:Hormone superfamily conopressin/conophysin n=1 Tax=Conus magus TaxID=6492 RepID=A0A5P8I0Y4_CONMA|nr:hormone superfamily conopressin/conophysin [Conus magus]